MLGARVLNIPLLRPLWRRLTAVALDTSDGGPIRNLFANGEQGYFFDPRDFNTMFQDAAGSVPVTAVGQPVGLILDKSGRGNHASQATATKRPILTLGADGQLRLAFDGIEDLLVIPGLDLSMTDKVTLCAGVLKLSDAAAGVIAEHGPNAGTTNGSFGMYAPTSPTPNIGWRSRGTGPVILSHGGVPAPIGSVLTGIGDIAAPLARLRRNGAPLTYTESTQGTGNYAMQDHFIGSRGGAGLFLNGSVSSLVCLGRQAGADELAVMESFANRREKAY
jgi:hypothetical protein